MIVLGLVLGCVSFAVALLALQSNVTLASPGKVSVNLEPGRWAIFERAPESSLGGTPTIKPEQLLVTGPDGTRLELHCLSCSGPTMGTPLDLEVFDAIADFEATTKGSYSIESTAPSGLLAVANPEKAFTQVFPWMSLLAMIGGGLVLVGIVLLIVGPPGTPGTTGGSPSAGIPQQRFPVTANSLPPPGWYPNPYLSDDSQMWWNGSEWTSNWR